MHYLFSCQQAAQHVVDIEFSLPCEGREEVIVRLPTWRPGRYELGNFAKSVRGLRMQSGLGEAVPFKKVDSHAWQVNTAGVERLTVCYSFHAHELNAGSTFIDAEQLYVNPVNCCMYADFAANKPCTVQLDMQPVRVATSLRKVGPMQFEAADFQELADSPFIASAQLRQHTFECCGAQFLLWFIGEAKPDLERIQRDFSAFIAAQHRAMGAFPFKEYHFLFQLPPYKLYHGVEHLKSTVIALGPGYELMEPALYKEFMGVSSHELFHAWNIKAIRPEEMQPYDFSRENFSRLGYVAEGVTTYYGDLFLLRAGFFKPAELLGLFARHAQRHFHNFGRYNLSVAESSYDTWLDGYVAGMPHRKLSIYSDGALLAWMCDVAIRKQTNNAQSLDDAMRLLYERFALAGKGYTEEAYWAVLAELSADATNRLRANFVDAANSYETELNAALSYLGLTLVEQDASNVYESDFGFKVDANNKVLLVHPHGPAAAAGLAAGDVVLGINNYRLDGNLAAWCRYFKGEQVALDVAQSAAVRKLTLQADGKRYFAAYAIEQVAALSAQQAAAFEAWSR